MLERSRPVVRADAPRRAAGRRADEQAQLILDNLDAVRGDLETGAIVVLGENTIRIRRLPIGRD